MIDNKEKKRERMVSSNQPSPNKGIETNPSLDRRPIPPPWHRVMLGIVAHSPQGIEKNQSLDRRPIPPPWHRVMLGIGAHSPQEYVHHKVIVSP